MQSAILFTGMPGPDRKVACLAYPTSGIPMEAKMADYICPTLAAIKAHVCTCRGDRLEPAIKLLPLLVGRTGVYVIEVLTESFRDDV